MDPGKRAVDAVDPVDPVSRMPQNQYKINTFERSRLEFPTQPLKTLSKPMKYNNFIALPSSSQMRRAGFDSKSQRFSYTSAKYCLALVKASVSLLLAGRQTLHTQWLERFPLSFDAVRGQSVALRAFCCGARRFAKRYVGAAKLVGATLGMFCALPAGSPNATCVRPGCFRRSRFVTTRLP